MCVKIIANCVGIILLYCNNKYVYYVSVFPLSAQSGRSAEGAEWCGVEE